MDKLKKHSTTILLILILLVVSFMCLLQTFQTFRQARMFHMGDNIQNEFPRFRK